MPKPQFTVSPQFKALRWRLLLSSLGVIACTLTAFGMVVYQVVAQSLEQKSDHQLRTLADAAAHSLANIAAQPEILSDEAPHVIDNDGDLDIPWQDLQQDQQSVEWFDANVQLLRRAGKFFPTTPLALPESDREANEIEDDAINTLTIAVYQPATLIGEKVLQGYVRVSESNTAIEEELERLRSALQWGGLLALILSGFGGWWLTQQSLQPIEQSMHQLKQFTADASHELRNPLTVIKTSVDVMQSHLERLHPADLAKLEAIASATNQMSQLVNDLLWLARTDQAVIHASPRLIIPLEELLEEVLDQYMSQAEQKQIALVATLDKTGFVAGDPIQLKRLFANLITNALHYTPSGGTVILTSTIEDNWNIVQVTDTGIGIAPEQIPLVFDRFWRSDQARTRREGGSGLGLAIAQAIADRHQGEITVRSQLGKGSCFQVSLPTG